ncbi:activator of HSP90 ATPase [Sphaerisporangium krabiense]|uniref:Uncharacterized protein YndB with AHSA1/START domain n=1 Tax=Sphaerisporangium krabiense TaxID=763782 RepID=A0A7W8Z5X3_9ACTN|nr:SRPBCC family protein [Sphaerisporangium krabiense]MBB5627718.1 uncharacterized protein YndB with AHSA1/START domain [Sphaerisporangium krabiense]GII61876.1 activator of HSP90 ATPase [Sphaerisporangium krabiense]
MDVNGQINAVQRRLGTRTLEAGEGRVLTIAQTYDATPEDVWDALTNAERIPRWFMPITGELRVGGRYQLEGNAGGTVERCDPPKFFSATWEYGEGMSWIEVRLTPDGDRTRFELQHIAPVTDSDEFWDTFGPGAVGIGWDLGVLGLAQHLGPGGGVKPEEAPAWLLSDEGKSFVTESSLRWRDASIAFGTDEAAATAAADRSTAAYTASPEESPES